MAARKPRRDRPKLPADRAIDLSIYADVSPLFEQALESPRGIGVTYNTPKNALSVRLRLYWFRRCDRSNNRIIYPKGDPLHGHSVFDTLLVSVDKNRLIITHRPGAPIITELASDDPAFLAQHPDGLDRDDKFYNDLGDKALSDREIF